MKDTNLIKRSKELAPLSPDHHEGLLFVWKIKQGLANKASFETLRNYSFLVLEQSSRLSF